MNNIRARKLERIIKGRKPALLDLFSGAGGLTLGFVTAGCEVVASVEENPHAAATYAENFFKDKNEEYKKLHARSRDISETDPEELLRQLGFENPVDAIDIIIGGPPCQAFARIGRAKLADLADDPEAFLQDSRGNLYLRFIEYVKKLQPLAILMENVPDALNYGGHDIAEETCDVLSEIGYECRYTILNSAYYGIPQMRERMFLIAYANELRQEPMFPEPTHYVDLPSGYHSGRSVVLRLFSKESQLQLFSRGYFRKPPEPMNGQLPAISAEDALGDLPSINAIQLLREGKINKFSQDMNRLWPYPNDKHISKYGVLMRSWPSFENNVGVCGHEIRYLPRDYKLFALLEPGDQYPQAYEKATALYEVEVARRKSNGLPIPNDLWSKFVPPYNKDIFPNKWRKMEPDMPARTVMAHLGKDSYSHIHYDSSQARTISVREAARLQSFPDGFKFPGSMNASFTQIGNAVPPLIAYKLACSILRSLQVEYNIYPVLSLSN